MKTVANGVGGVPIPSNGDGSFRIYKSKAYFAIPSKLWRDSSFPFKKDEDVEIIVNENSIEIIKANKSQQRLQLIQKKKEK